MSDKKRKTATKKKTEEDEDEEPKKKTRQTKLSKQGKVIKDVESEEEEEEPKKKTKKTSGELVNKSNTDITEITSICDDEDKYFKIISWNVNGLNGILKKANFAEYIITENPDVICLGETKTSKTTEPDLKKILGKWDKNPKVYWNHSTSKKGYSGTAIITKESAVPLSVSYGIPDQDKHNGEGRVVTVEYDKYYLVNTYIPNAGQKLDKLDYKQEWDKDFYITYLNDLKKKKHVVLTGDLNVAHKEIDLKNPKTNSKTAGFTKEERKDFDDFLKTGWIDTYRIRNPEKKDAYTYWSYKRQARQKDVGWRIDYFVVNKDFNAFVQESYIRKQVFGSDHCPVGILIKKEIEPIKQEEVKEKK
eukprot:TRINITY_DN6659_c0_g1_i1.p1 TRINITY_DN6659_c0_g1~~TRINITY_DN6659_c0_g1_i1.p1  ORF type:complete len:361 (+),score=131.73 TRINITY_DN6659_c0_g1_i1:64-1146(+)